MGSRVSYPVEKQKAVEMRFAGVPMKKIIKQSEDLELGQIYEITSLVLK